MPIRLPPERGSRVLRCRSFPEPAMLGEDLIVRRPVVRNVRMVVLAENEGCPLQWMMPDPPAALRVAVHFAHAGVDTEADCADQRCLTEVGSEAGPEVVIHVRSAVESPGVECKPMAERTEEGEQERQQQNQKEQARDPDDSVPGAVWRILRWPGRCGVLRVASRHRRDSGFRRRGWSRSRRGWLRGLSHLLSDPRSPIAIGPHICISRFCRQECQ